MLPSDPPDRGRQGFGRPPLARLLLMAGRWFDAQVLDQLERRGWPRLSPAQSLLFAHLHDDAVSPAELARRLGRSRQATSELVAGLVRLHLLQVNDGPRRRGGRLICITDRGRDLALDAYGILLDPRWPEPGNNHKTGAPSSPRRAASTGSPPEWVARVRARVTGGRS